MTSIVGNIRSAHRKTQQCEIQREAFNEREKTSHIYKKEVSMATDINISISSYKTIEKCLQNSKRKLFLT